VSEDPTREDSTRGHSFDELARAVAEGSLSRRRALKLFAGTAIASLIPSRALADGRKRWRRNHHDDDDDDDECFVPICHVPRTSTGECDEANARTIFVRRRQRRRHLKNHPCDRKGKCPRDKTSSTTTGTPTTTTTGTPTTTTTGTPTATTTGTPTATTTGTPTTTTTGTPTTTTT
jgi:hypothetical protein